MNEIVKFEGSQIRITYVNNEPFFVAKDVCSSLALSNVSQALSDLDDDEKGIISNDTLGGKQKLLHVSESGMYSLMMKSRKAEAKVFRKWITKDVLPTIRKTGSYSVENRSKKWLNDRVNSISIRKEETEVIKEFVDYAITQGASKRGAKMYYATFTKEVYKALSIDDKRDNTSGIKLLQITALESTIKNSLKRSMDENIHYKDAYKIAKLDFIKVAELAGFKVLE